MMKMDTVFFGAPQGAPEAARQTRAAGLDGMWVTETGHDPFLALLLATQAAPELDLGTGIAVGFARSPMTLAQTCWDLAALSRGKMLLGLGSQVKAHITRRFSMPWGNPIDQMRELVAALRTIWKCFETGDKLLFEGEYYKLSLLTPFFTPEKHEFSSIPVGLAAVGPKMTELGGEVADFLSLHSFTNLRYLENVTMPAVEAGLTKSGRDRKSLCLSGSLFVITGDAQAQAEMEVAVRRQVAFYGSTPAYHPVLEAIGYGEVGAQLHAMSRRGEWEEMGRLITDDLLDHFVVRAAPADLRQAVQDRFGHIYDRVTLSLAPSELRWLK